jgi:hypothetical protein
VGATRHSTTREDGGFFSYYRCHPRGRLDCGRERPSLVLGAIKRLALERLGARGPKTILHAEQTEEETQKGATTADQVFGKREGASEAISSI